MFLKNRYCVLLLFLLLSLQTIAQKKPGGIPDTTSSPKTGAQARTMALPGGAGYMPSIIPPSPNMSSLGKFIEHPVNNYTGIPTVSIPLYNIQHRDISVPIDINYHAGGNKVESVASWVGLGWSVSIGGSVTRSVRGLPDDLYTITKNILAGPNCATYNNVGYLYSASEIETMYNETNTNSTTFLDDLREVGMGAKDGISDLFYFNFGKYSGHFVFGPTGSINIVPQQDLKITPIRPDSKEITGFVVTTPEGIQYTFSDIERSVITTRGANVRLSDPNGFNYMMTTFGPFFGVLGGGSETSNGCGTDLTRIAYNSSWQLTKIVSAKSGEEVTFSYREEKTHVQSFSGETLFWWTTGDNNTAYRIKSAVSNYTRAKVIESITWPAGNVQFKIDLNDPRQDTDRKYSSQNDAGAETIRNYALDKIEVYETSGTKIKSFDFTYSYFQSPTLPDFSDGSGTNYTYYKNALAKRLKLESVTEAGVNPYVFKYNATALPHRASTEQDFWGYYKPNGSNSLIPITYEYPAETVSSSSFHTSSFSIYPRQTYTGTQIIHTSAAWDRSTDTTASKAAVLTEVVYPTKGGTLFTYSPNEFYVSGQKITGGGLRIRQMRISPSASYNSSDDIVKNYDYQSSGQIVDLPVFAAYGSKGAGGVMFFGDWSGGLALTKGSYVGYGQVSEAVAGNGKTVYKYKTPAMYGTTTEGLYSRPVTEKKYLTYGQHYGPVITPCVPWPVGALKWDYYPRPFAPNYEWGRGLLDEVETWDQSGNMIKKVKNNYTIKAHTKINNIQVAVVHIDDYAVEDLGVNTCWAGRHCYNFTRTYDISPWIVMDKTTEYTYNGSTSPVTKVQDLLYDSGNHRQMTRKRISQSDASILETSFKYPFEYQSVVGKAAFVQKMIDQNILTSPLETTTVIEKSAADRKVIDASVTTYKAYAGPAAKPELMLPYKAFRFNGYNGSLGAVFSYYEGKTDETATTSYREILKYTNYDAKGNPLSLVANGFHKISYLWAYNGQFPVAEIKNADYGAVETALTSAGTSYAALSAMTVSDDIKAKVDAARISLSSSQVSGYQYYWLTGLSSVTDATNKVLYYERDLYGRLKTIHSGAGLTRVTYCYNYAGQASACDPVSTSGIVTPPALALIPEREDPPLPVTLVNFAAVKEETVALLTWQTTVELNSEGFDIERSPDGKNWKKLGTVVSHGNSNQSNNYSFRDVQPAKGENLYRLKMVDRDGTYAYSRIRSLVFGQGLEILFYPNPVTVGETLQLKSSDPSRISQISIFDNAGKMLMETGYQTEINIKELAAGLYIIQVVGTDGSVTKHKIVKQ